MTDWNKQPREECERAAAAGDVDAQTAVRMHESLDRIDAKIAKMLISSREHSEKMHAELDRIKALLQS